jgi:hypothetical protein
MLGGGFNVFKIKKFIIYNYIKDSMLLKVRVFILENIYTVFNYTKNINYNWFIELPV